MADLISTLPRTGEKTLLAPTVTLAVWRLRQTWGLLLITGVGLVAAVMLVCAVPLYSEVAMSAGVRGILTASFQNATVQVRSSSQQISSAVINTTTQHLNRTFHKDLGPYLLGPAQFSIETPLFSVLASRPGQNGNGPLRPTGERLQLTGTSIDQAPAHLKLVQGRLPQPSGSTLEIAVNSQTAALLQLTYQVHLGSVLHVSMLFVDSLTGITSAHTLTLHLVGIFDLTREDDPFWNGDDFISQAPDTGPTTYRGIVSNQTILAAFTQLFHPSASASQGFYSPASLIWSYRLDPSRISVDNLNEVINAVQTVQVDNGNDTDLENFPYVGQTLTYLPAPALELYSSRISVAQIPVASLSFLVLGLVLFFVSMMASLLVERQSDALAVLRSRGASQRQLFSSLVTQCLGIALIALIAGPLLAIVLVRLLAQRLLAPSDQSALNLIAGNPLPVALGLRWYALAAIAVAVIAMVITIAAAIRLDVLALRREAARSTHRPIWQRLNLDIIAVVIALLGYVFSVYLTNSNVLDARLHLVLLSPLTLLESICLLIAGLLLFLRFFPLLLRLSVWLAMRNRGASPLLALAQMARAPRQSIRMTLLLTLALAFAIFTLVFTASQSQRILAVAAYQSGADFSGVLRVNYYTSTQLTNATADYGHISGVTSATVGYTNFVKGGGSIQSIRIDFKAVDANTFAHTAIWTDQDSSQSLDSLMTQLAAERGSALAKKVVPAIVDASTWNALRLYPGATFTLSFSSVGYSDIVTFRAIARVPVIPTSSDASVPVVLVDYQSFAAVYTKTLASGSTFVAAPNAVWLRTLDDAASLSHVRETLNQGKLQLDFLYDRRAIIADLSHEPLYLDLIGVLALGATTALLLALVGNLIASWLSARNRLTSFVLLRALGAAPRQVASTLLWEQGIIYATAIVLGSLFGALLSVLVIPALVITSVAPTAVNGNLSSGDFYAVQNAPPVQLIVPPSLGLILAVFVLICIIALALMVRVVSRPALGQTLRLNED